MESNVSHLTTFLLLLTSLNVYGKSINLYDKLMQCDLIDPQTIDPETNVTLTKYCQTVESNGKIQLGNEMACLGLVNVVSQSCERIATEPTLKPALKNVFDVRISAYEDTSRLPDCRNYALIYRSNDAEIVELNEKTQTICSLIDGFCDVLCKDETKSFCLLLNDVFERVGNVGKTENGVMSHVSLMDVVKANRTIKASNIEAKIERTSTFRGKTNQTVSVKKETVAVKLVDNNVVEKDVVKQNENDERSEKTDTNPENVVKNEEDVVGNDKIPEEPSVTAFESNVPSKIDEPSMIIDDKNDERSNIVPAKSVNTNSIPNDDNMIDQKAKDEALLAKEKNYVMKPIDDDNEEFALDKTDKNALDVEKDEDGPGKFEDDDDELEDEMNVEAKLNGDVKEEVKETEPPKSVPKVTTRKYMRPILLPADNMDETVSSVPYVLVGAAFIFVAYILVTNKQKALVRHCLGLILEGKPGRGGRRRPNSANYRKLDSNLEEVIASSGGNTAHSNVIY